MQARRKRSDLDYLKRFPLYVVPTYPGDERPPAAPIHWLSDDEDWTEAPELGMLGRVFNLVSDDPLLNGGLPKWEAEGRPLTARRVGEPDPTRRFTETDLLLASRIRRFGTTRS